MKNLSIRISNFKCFQDEPQGFTRILPVNVIIGRNNSGKSALLDMVDGIISGELRGGENTKRNAEYHLSLPIETSALKKIFPSHNLHYGNVRTSDIYKCLEGVRIHFKIKSRTPTGQYSGQAIFQGFEPELNNQLQGLPKIETICNHIPLPFDNMKFFRLVPARDISPETGSGSLEIQMNGEGATNSIQRIINLSGFPRELVEITILSELNKILQDDAHFNRILPMQISNEKWEIFLEEDGKGQIALSDSGSGLKTVMLVLAILFIAPKYSPKMSLENCCFGFEELENNLHPALQRRLFNYLYTFALDNSCTIFITTHSGIVLDLFSSRPEVQTIHVTQTNAKVEVRAVDSYIDRCHTLEDLDIRASDVLQSNSVIWVEGPSDREYINRWISLFTSGKLIENYHYQCMFYGGKLLSNIHARVPTDQVDRAISVLALNRHAIVVIDSDKRKPHARINKTKTRIREEVGNSGGYAWITYGREIENYLSVDCLKRVYGNIVTTSIGRYESISDYLENISKGEGSKMMKNKVEYAVKYSKTMTFDDLKVNDLYKRIEDICGLILKWNGQV